MSKYVIRSPFNGEGRGVCVCKHCGKEQEFEFQNNHYNMDKIKSTLESLGWKIFEFNNQRFDFCCMEHYKEFIKAGDTL